MINREIAAFIAGVENLFDDELINQSAAQDSKNWYNQSGRLILVPGKLLVGQSGVAGNVTGEIFGYRVDGSKVHWRKIGAKIQYDAGTAAVPNWVDVITGLTAAADYSFTNYSSLAGAFTFAIGIDGIFKMNNANPGSYLAMYSSTKNFKGKAFIDKGRMILWDVPNDKTVLRGSHIDPQNGTVYTSVTSETLYAADGAYYAGTLAGIGTSATGTLTSDTTAPGDGDTVTIGTTVYTFKLVLTGAAYEVLIGASAAAALDNLKSAVNGTAGAGTTYGTGTVAHPTVAAVTNTNTTQLFVARTGGTAGNSIATTETSAHLSFGATTLASGASAGATRNMFGLVITGTTAGGVETFTDNFLGVLTGSLGGVGTINYLTGAYQVTFSGPVISGNVVATSYQWEDSNTLGVTDFTKSSTRVAGEGFQFPQDEGGDPIMNVVIGSNGYYSMKQNSAYMLSIDSDDLGATNDVYRKTLGTQSYRGSLATSQGIIFINTNNPEKPEMTILQPNLAGDSLVPKILFPAFKFANYLYDDCTIETYERYILVACKSLNAVNNDTLLLCDLVADTVNITGYAGRTFPSNNGILYMGSSIVQSVYELFSGFDDDGYPVDNYWIGKGETFAVKSRGLKYASFGQNLKKYRKIRLKGSISLNQSYGVYVSYDDAGFQLVGTVLGSGSYVDYASPQTIGSNYVGESQIGGDQLTSLYPYFVEIRLKKVPKFRKRTMKIVALGIGYADIEYQEDWGIDVYEGKIPARFRQKQNVSLDGRTVDNDNPAF